MVTKIIILLVVHYSCGQLRLFLDITIYRKSLNEYAVTTYTHIPFWRYMHFISHSNFQIGWRFSRVLLLRPGGSKILVVRPCANAGCERI